MSKLTYRELRDILNGLPAEQLEKPVIVEHYSAPFDEFSYGSIEGVVLDKDVPMLTLTQHNSIAEAMGVSHD
jgi:hypothetical protein